MYHSGSFHTEARKRQNSGSDQGAKRQIKPGLGHGAVGRGSYNGIGDSPMLHPHHGRVCNSSDDAGDAAHAVRISARLPASKPRQRRLTINAHLGQTDR